MPDDDGRPVAVTVREERLRHMLAKLADWRKANAKGDLVPTPPPTGLVKSLVATPDPALPVLAGIVTAPVLGRGGVLLTEPGYHPDARLFCRPPPGFLLPPVPERPAPAEIAAACDLLLDDLLGDFPFTGEAERAHALCLLLLGFVRPMIDAPTPLHMIEKPTPGTGATLMVDAIATILTGAGASVMTEGRDEDEWRKRLTAKLRQLLMLLLIGMSFAQRGPGLPCGCTVTMFLALRTGGRAVEGARLESAYTSKAYRGFESLPVRQFPYEPCRPPEQAPR